MLFVMHYVGFDVAQECLRRLKVFHKVKKVQEGSGCFKKVQVGSRRFKKIQSGSRRIMMV